MSRRFPDINAHVTAWRASGLNQVAYCRTVSIPTHRLRDAIRRQRPAAAGFIEVPRPVPNAAADMSVVLECSGGQRLVFRGKVDPSWIGQVVRAMVSAC